MNTVLKSIIEKSTALTRRFAKEEDGVSATEFALVTPFLAGLYFMFVGVAGGNHTASRVGQVASTVSDIISQSPGLTADQIDLALKAGAAIAGTEHASNMAIEAVGVSVSNSGAAKVVWSRDASGGKPYATGSSYTLPPSLLSQPGFVVASRTYLAYSPVVGSGFLPGNSVPLEYKYYFVPRASEATFCNDC